MLSHFCQVIGVVLLVVLQTRMWCLLYSYEMFASFDLVLSPSAHRRYMFNRRKNINRKSCVQSVLCIHHYIHVTPDP